MLENPGLAPARDCSPASTPTSSSPTLDGTLDPAAAASHTPDLKFVNELDVAMSDDDAFDASVPHLASSASQDSDSTIMGADEHAKLADREQRPLAQLASAVSEAVAGDDERPAKRAKTEVADPVPTRHIASSSPQVAANLTPAQHKFAVTTMRQLKRLKDSSPFLCPVDFVELKIPHYPVIIKEPMDISTIEFKLALSNPSKPAMGNSTSNPRYFTADEFSADVRRIFNNCYVFNGPDHPISVMAKRLEIAFEKQIVNMPKATDVSVSPSPKPFTPKAAKAPKAASSAPRRLSAMALDTPVVPPQPPASANRLKRDVYASHLNPETPVAKPKAKSKTTTGLPSVLARPKPSAKPRVARDDGAQDQLRFCSKVLTELFKKQHWDFASPFYDPVDAKFVPDYYKIIKRPIDLTSMRKKLDAHAYPSAERFHADFQLLINNCFIYNAVGSPVRNAGQKLKDLFEEKWRALPPLRTLTPEPEEEPSEDERAVTIAMMENEIETMRDNLLALKAQKPPKKEKAKKSAPTPKPPKPSTSAPKPKPAAPAAPPKKKSVSKKKSEAYHENYDHEITYEQKTELSNAVQALEGARIGTLIEMIRQGLPHLTESGEEIELDIDQLPPPLFSKVWAFAVGRPLRAPKQPKVKKIGGKVGTATGGLKRKSMDEEVESEKIRKLEAQIALFDQPNTLGGTSHAMEDRSPLPQQTMDDSASSDSGSEGSDSGSESD
ncbi:hypothetical protein BOTBODRAFT_27280 [Botryobasidium botryosum FD-172 SS1]|uniref:Bromo domain-containing protein n=1 Tax=Botryobasidium botryosum (strain FD-172 SS1) TaxID=930990 RepID=A0A067MW95_BOTB1|nr:hypothetical protein BOTBODRAFT_27280 [Botryobasidium botryosum FD-172 SS1]